MRGLRIILAIGWLTAGSPAFANHDAGSRSFRPLAAPLAPVYGGGRLSQGSLRVQLSDTGLQADTYEEATNVCRELAPSGFWQLPRELDIQTIGLETMQATLWNYAPGSPLWLQPERSGTPPQQGHWSFLDFPRFAVEGLTGPSTGRVYCVHPVETPALFTFPRPRIRFRFR